jgi:hypothetical protein
VAHPEAQAFETLENLRVRLAVSGGISETIKRRGALAMPDLRQEKKGEPAAPDFGPYSPSEAF